MTYTPLSHCCKAPVDFRDRDDTNLYCTVCGKPYITLAEPTPTLVREKELREELVKDMVSRFLRWKLPDNFSPDAGITFIKYFNVYTEHPMKHEPSGTNLFDAIQAKEMVEYMLAGLPDILHSELERKAKEVEGLKKTGIHEFEVGTNICKWCGLQRKGRYPIRENIIMDEKSGGSSATVTAIDWDITGQPCEKNLAGNFNLGVDSARSLITDLIANLEKK